MSWKRLENARAHEREVAERIRALGHTVEPFGQELLSESVREYLKDTNSLLRWLPDMSVMIAAARVILLVDAKGCMSSNTPNHSIEMRSLLGGELTGLPVWYVCSDFKALSLAGVVEDGLVRPCCPDCWTRFLSGDPHQLPKRCPDHERYARRGTGTPYVLVSKSRCIDLDHAMPPASSDVA